MSVNEQSKILEELIINQNDNVMHEYKLSYSDIKRLSKNLDNSIFNNDCSIWKGFVNEKKNNKKYVNFYFRKKKIAINRLLYMNYKGDLNQSDYLTYNCPNQGVCCNINHIEIKNKDINKKIIKDKKEKKVLNNNIENKPKIIKNQKIIFE